MISTDLIILTFDRALKVLSSSMLANRPTPGKDCSNSFLKETDLLNTVKLMRINHTGEVCAQALYQGQALTARNTSTHDALKNAAQEEIDHLAWCEERIKELGGRISFLNPLWYIGSFTLGVAAGMAGDGWSLAFLKETEKQVEKHLDSHLQKLSPNDLKTRAIIKVMRDDEKSHAELAQSLGAYEFPGWLKGAMKLSSSIMTKTVYWV